MTSELKSLLRGTDINNEISLFQYGSLIAPYTQDGNPDEYFAIYQVEPGKFDTGYIREKQLNDIINGLEWASKEDIDNFLSFCGCTKEEWLQFPMEFKLQDCLGYWGYPDIMGDCHHALDADKAKELYL